MRLPNLSSITLIALLCGCQPESKAPAVPQTTPAVSATISAEVASAVPVAAPSAVVAITEPAKVVAPVVTPATSSTKKPISENPPPAQVVTKPPVTEVVPTVEKVVPPVATPVVNAKPEAKTANVLAEADALQLAKKSGCLTCHSIEKKIVGPAWRDVATKYRGDASAQSTLDNKVAKGGKGAWGNMAMPANSPRVAEADIHSLVSFILSLK